MWWAWFTHISVTLCMAILATVLQHFLHPVATSHEWRIIFAEQLEGLYLHTDILRDRWIIQDDPAGGILKGITLNKLVLLGKSTIRMKERYSTSGGPWEISMELEELCGQRPYEVWASGARLSTGSFTFSESPLGRYILDFDPGGPDKCGLYLENQNERELIGECTQICKEKISAGSQRVNLRGEGEDLSLFVEGSLCASGSTGRPIEELMFEISVAASSCLAIDDLTIRVKEPGIGWTTQLDERFTAAPLQSGWLNSRFDLDSRGSRVAVLWALVIAALLIDLVALAFFGRASPVQALMVNSVPQAAAIVIFQRILFLPLAPVMFCIAAVWTSKAVFAFFGRPPRRSGGGYTLRPGLFHKQSVLFWLMLALLQSLHWFWFRRVWIFIEWETFALAALIPSICLIGFTLGGIRKPAWVRIPGMLVAAVLLVICIEVTVRSTPVDFLLDFDWRTRNSFWLLKEHTNLIVDHSKEEFFKNVGDPTREDLFGGNEKGIFQREKPKGALRIVCLGSSSTWGEGCEARSLESYPSQLGPILESCSSDPVEIINAGVPGYRLTQLRIYFEQILSGLEPDILILYFGGNSDSPIFQEYYERVESLLQASPGLLYPREVEAALSLNLPHPLLVRTYLLLARARLFVGMKLILDAIDPGGRGTRWDLPAPADHEFLVESADRLVKAALKQGIAVILVPEIFSVEGAASAYGAVFKEVTRLNEGDTVRMLEIEGSSIRSHMVDTSHMNADGYGELAGIIADYLIDSDLVPCGRRLTPST